MTAFVSAGAGFLLAVIWFDLMFDVQIFAKPSADGSKRAATESIAAYYRRVTTDARPMNELVRVVMLATMGTMIGQLVLGTVPRWVAGVSLAATMCATGLAMARTFRSAVRLGRGEEPEAKQVALAETIARDHVFSFLAITLVLVLELGFGRG